MSGPSRGAGFRPLRTLLETWKPGDGREPDPVHAIATAWPGIVGLDVASCATPLEIAGNMLVIGTRSSAWSQQLQLLSLPILTGIRALPGGSGIDRLTFRTGSLPRVRRRGAAPALATREKILRPEPETAPAASLEDAFWRLRRRMSRTLPAAAACRDCGAPIAVPTAQRRGPGAAAVWRCAPCAGVAEGARRIAVERVVYLAPWLTVNELRSEMPDLGVPEFERARKALLARWWLILERARRAGRVSATGLERHVGSSYVLLQSRLPPDRISAAVVRNLLGGDLERLLWPRSVEAASIAAGALPPA